MSVSAQPDLPPARLAEHIVIEITEEQLVVISQAADLLGWTVPEYLLCAVLDRAERDLYVHAALLDDEQPHRSDPHPSPDGPLGPLTALVDR